jgi:hypothetical protein
LTSEVHATELPAPWRQRARIGSPRSEIRIVSAVGVLDAGALDRLDLLGDADVDDVLDELGLLGLLRLLHEDLGERADVLDHVEPAVTDLGDLGEEVAVGARDADGGDRDPGAAHVGH